MIGKMKTNCAQPPTPHTLKQYLLEDPHQCYLNRCRIWWQKAYIINSFFINSENITDKHTNIPINNKSSSATPPPKPTKMQHKTVSD